MSLSLGIVGLPNVGKSTLFNALTKSTALAANYPFATIEPNVGQVPLPDSRLTKLAEIYHSEKIVPNFVNFIDIAGIVKGASKGEGMGNAFLSHIRQVDAICLLIRVFNDPDIIHVEGKVDPLTDIEIIQTELILADMQTLDKALPRLEKEAKKNRDLVTVWEVAKEALNKLDEGKILFSVKDSLDLNTLRELHLLTSKPFLYVFNMDEGTLTDSSLKEKLINKVAPADSVFLDVGVESELLDLDPQDAKELLASIGQSESGLEALAREGFKTLNLQTFLTAGEKEARAWTIHKGDTAPKAAGVIHSDFEKGFIKAEVISFDDLVAAGSLQSAKANGKLRLEGKDYIMQDGDIVEFKFNL